MTPSHRLGVILVAVSTLAWSTAGLFTRAIDADLMTVIVWRSLFGALEAPFAPPWVWLLLCETPSAATMVGGMIVMTAVVRHILRSTHRG